MKPKTHRLTLKPWKTMKLASTLVIALTLQVSAAVSSKTVTLSRKKESINLTSVQKQIKGKVVDEKGIPIPGANITVKGTNIGTQADADGKFSISVPENGAKLIVSFIGFDSQEVAIGNSTLTIVLKETGQKLDEVVVVGYGTQKKKDLVGSVASVSSKDFKEQAVTNISQILQGRASGVQVISNSGAPGGAVSVRIRGNNSIVGDNSPLYVVDGFVGTDPSSINPNDIETMDILKDAPSTAIYGSRGANGVIVITTKKGKAGKSNISFMTQLGGGNVVKKLDLLGAADYARTLNERAAATGLPPVFTQQQINNYAANGGTDWQNEIFRSMLSQEYQLNISGGNEKTNYFTSGNYLNQSGILLNTGLKRYALRIGLNSKLTDKLSLHLNSSATRNEVLNGAAGSGGRFSSINQAITWSPTEPVRDANGKYTRVDPYNSIDFNPVAYATDQSNVSNNSLFTSVVGLKYEFIPGLTFDATGGLNYNNIQNLNFSDATINSLFQANAGRSSTENIGVQSTNNLTYAHTFNNAHNLVLTGVIEYQSYTSNYFNASGNNLTYPETKYYNIGLSGTYGIGSGYTESTLLSYLGRATYDYKGIYYVSASVRRDGSSKFQKDNQYSTFPSAGAAWKISEMDFMKNKTFFNSLKFRGGYGLTGNQAINPYQTLSLYNTATTTIDPGKANPGIVLGNPGNPDLKWETTRQWDLGLDADMFDNRVSFTADYYDKLTDNLLLNVPVPAYMGGGSVLSNVGAVSNKGLEFSLTYRNSKDAQVHWSSSANLSFLRNKIESLYSPSNIPSSTAEFMLIPGQPMGTFWGLTYLGTWKPSEAAAAAAYNNKPGDSKYLDLNGDHIIDGSDYHAIGHGLPKYTWGWNNDFVWKGLTLNVFIQSAGGFDKLDGSIGTIYAGLRQATAAGIADRYIPGVNETSDIPAFSLTDKNYSPSTRFLEDATYIRLKNISLSYQIPKEYFKGFGATVFLRGTNLITITKYKGFDPETNSLTTGAGSDVNQSLDNASYPNAKLVTLGVKLEL
ncbi:SusC/RagA family TonB-linked outer membrane protein [Flavobacterium gilvum]|nr:TonB-dependent receptor [Flavobacterium gilvum]